MKHILIITSIFISLIIIATMAQTTWTKNSYSGHFSGLVFANNQFVGVGSRGNIVKSTNNGTSWQVCTSGVTLNLAGVIYGNSLYVAVGDTGTIVTSTNATSWTQRTSGTKRCFHNVAYGNSLYVAVGDTGTILTSLDGIIWTQRTSGTAYDLYGITFANNQFVSVGRTGTILTSPDGITWTNHSIGIVYTFYNIAFGNNIYVVVGTGASGATNTLVYTSPDGVTWTDRTAQGITGFQNCYALTYGAGYFVTANIDGTIFISANSGYTWQPVQYLSSDVFLCAAYGNNTFVVAGRNVYTSPAVSAIRYTAPKAVGSQLLTITNNMAKFTLTQAAKTNLTLFDLTGKTVASLISGNKAAGTYNAALPAKLPQGRYVLSLKSGEVSCVTTVMITR